jgi:hypothetical protein
VCEFLLGERIVTAFHVVVRRQHRIERTRTAVPGAPTPRPGHRTHPGGRPARRDDVVMCRRRTCST